MILLKRFFAYAVDLAIFIPLFYLYVSTFGTPSIDGGGYNLSGIYYLPPILIWYSCFLVPEIKWNTTLGKKVFGLRVTKADGSKVQAKDLVIRRSLDLLELFFMPLIAMIAVGVTSKHQRLGDLFAKTQIIEQKKVKK